MTATGILLIVVGLFVVLNASNLVGVIDGSKRFNNVGSTNDTTG